MAAKTLEFAFPPISLKTLKSWEDADVFTKEVEQLFEDLKNLIWEVVNDHAILIDLPVLPSYAVASLPSASNYARGLIYVSDETGGATVAFSDGTNWRRVQDRAIVS